jgi:Tol biopolymer transport system component
MVPGSQSRLPDEERVAATTLGALALSPDNRTIVYVAPQGSTTQLLRRPIDTGTVSPIQGTAGATTPFFSPDGEWIAFYGGTVSWLLVAIVLALIGAVPWLPEPYRSAF